MVREAGARVLVLHKLSRHVAKTNPALAPVLQRHSAAAAVRAVVAGSVGVAPGLAASIVRRGGLMSSGQGGASQSGNGGAPGVLRARVGAVAPGDLVRIARQALAPHTALAPAVLTRDAVSAARAVRRRGAGAPLLGPRWRATPALPSIAPRGAAGASGAAAVARHAPAPALAPLPSSAAQGANAGRLPPRTAGRQGPPAGAAPALSAAVQAETARQRRDAVDALQTYFQQQARLPPSSGAGFDPRLTPAWAGLQIPG